ncbi:hypothetical protein B0H14DRAFT_2580882 [Mycena olivaceomarginata]|nr:hypothetical protein B0H14DRAFT_2580882 [Mycena olivaceomarginata]
MGTRTHGAEPRIHTAALRRRRSRERGEVQVCKYRAIKEGEGWRWEWVEGVKERSLWYLLDAWCQFAAVITAPTARRDCVAAATPGYKWGDMKNFGLSRSLLSTGERRGWRMTVHVRFRLLLHAKTSVSEELFKLLGCTSHRVERKLEQGLNGRRHTRGIEMSQIAGRVLSEEFQFQVTETSDKKTENKKRAGTSSAIGLNSGDGTGGRDERESGWGVRS